MSIKSRRSSGVIAPACRAALGLLLGGLCVAPAAPAQTPAPAPGAPPQARPVPPRDILSNDPRLDAKITLRRTKALLPDALRELTRQTKVALAVGGNELPSDAVALAVTGEPLRDVMRALALVNDCHWKRVTDSDGKAVLTLMDRGDDPRFWDQLRPKTQAEADVDQGLTDFAQQLSQLPPDAQRPLTYDEQSTALVQGAQSTALPPAMQQSLQQAFGGELQMLAAKKVPTHATVDSLRDMNVSVQMDAQGDAPMYIFHIDGKQIGMTISLVVPNNDLGALDNTVPPPGFVPWSQTEPQTVADWYTATRAWSLKADPRLAQPVSLKTDEDPVGVTLAALADAAHVNAVGQVYPGSGTLSLSSVPLGSALDRVASKYKAAWGEAADGTLLVHYDTYPGPDPQAATN